MEKEGIIIFGASEHARCVIDIIEQVDKYQIIGIVDLLKDKDSYYQDYKILGGIEDLPKIVKDYNVHKGIIAIGDDYLREKKTHKIRKLASDFFYITAIHPSAIIGKRVSIGCGTVIMAGAIINNDSTIGEHCYLSTKSSMGHDSIIGDFSSLGPGVTTGGRTTIGVCSAVGIGANILNGRSIGNHSVIGAGSLVTKDVDDFIVAYGVPAKMIRHRNAEEKYL